MDAMAALGKRWFAKSPAGYPAPSQSAVTDVGVYGNLLYKGEVGKILMDAINRLSHDAITTRVAYINNIQTWLQGNGPTIFVDEEILEMCENTDVLANIHGSDIKTVYPTGYICLPQGKGFKSAYTGDSLHHIWFQIYEPGMHKAIINGEEFNLGMRGRRLFIHAYWDTVADCSSFLLPLDSETDVLSEVIRVNSTKLLAGQVTRGRKQIDGTLEGGITDTSTGMSPEDLSDESHDLCTWMAPLICNILLLMQSYPQYFDKMDIAKSSRQNFKGSPPPVSMILRRSPKKNVFQKVVGSSNERSEPTGATVSRHWRRGHWRRQVHGDLWELQNPDVRVIEMTENRRAHMNWIVPILVNADLVQDPALVEQRLAQQ